MSARGSRGTRADQGVRPTKRNSLCGMTASPPRLSRLTLRRRCPTIESERAMRTRTERTELTSRWASFFLVLAATAVPGAVRGQGDVRVRLEGQYTRTVRPFVETYCIGCHGPQRPAA